MTLFRFEEGKWVVLVNQMGHLRTQSTHVFTHRTKKVQKYILIRENITKPCTVKYQLKVENSFVGIAQSYYKWKILQHIQFSQSTQNSDSAISFWKKD